MGGFDNDGDPDLIISKTANPNSSVSRLYKNDPIGRLSEVTTIDVLDGLKAGTSHFTDLDADDLFRLLQDGIKLRG